MAMTQRDVAAQYLAMSASEIQAKQAEAYEEAVVRHIIGRIGMGSRAAEVTDSADGKYTCVGLMRAIAPPFLLAAFKLKHNPKLDAMLDKRFARSVLFKRYNTAFDDIVELAHGCAPRLLVFPWRGHSRFMVLHNSVDGACHRGRYYRVDGVKYYIEYLDDILDELGPTTKW
jgi:hypothetical protein